MRAKLFLTTILLCSFFVSNAQTKYLKNTDEVRNLTKKATGYFQENKIPAFFDEITNYWPAPDNELIALEEKTIKYINILEDRFGKSGEIVKVNEETIKDFALRETYILKFEHSAIRLKFTYFRNVNGWILNAFKWDDSFEQEFK